ncbi:SPOR domain-containing protein [Arhodomonas sp. SL1]|uniref:SPOR domain-containing protein n=1 Tax=Arhodomonas sp. SL1 TaxID=3425691 RepID=UPI003F881ABC
MAASRGQSGRGARRRSGGRGKAQGRSLPGWLWGLGGLAAGLAVAVLVHWHHTSGGPEQLAALFGGTPEQPTTTPAEPQGTPEGGDRPRFEFYRLLPEQEVEVPDERPTTAKRGETAEPAGPAVSAEDGPVAQDQAPPAAERSDGRDAAEQAGAEGQRYLLQAGSFRQADDADRMKAELALLGVEARVQRVELSGGELWHRVRLGPFADLQRVNTIRRRLQDNGIETILLKRSG